MLRQDVVFILFYRSKLADELNPSTPPAHHGLEPGLYLSVDLARGLINYKNTKAKYLHLKNLTRKGTLRQVFICLRPPPLLGFYMGW